jgi:hypothetical protein
LEELLATEDSQAPTMSRSAATSPARRPDRLGALLAAGFIVLLLVTEGALTLPDAAASDSAVASFYATHSAGTIVLQVLGFVAAGLLAAYSWRLRGVDRVVSAAGLLVSITAVVPGLLTLVLAAVADPANAGRAGQLNRLEPRGDDILFVGILLFALAVALRLGRRLPPLGVLAAVVALSCLARLGSEMAGSAGGALDSVAPLAFLLLVAVLAVLSYLGILRPERPV